MCACVCTYVRLIRLNSLDAHKWSAGKLVPPLSEKQRDLHQSPTHSRCYDIVVYGRRSSPFSAIQRYYERYYIWINLTVKTLTIAILSSLFLHGEI